MTLLFTLEKHSHSEEEFLPSSDPSTWKQLTPADIGLLLF